MRSSFVILVVLLPGLGAAPDTSAATSSGLSSPPAPVETLSAGVRNQDFEVVGHSALVARCLDIDEDGFLDWLDVRGVANGRARISADVVLKTRDGHAADRVSVDGLLV